MLTAYGRSAMLAGLLVPEFSPSLSVMYLALLRTPMRMSDDGATLDEVVGGGYARVSVGVGSTYWSLDGDGYVTNASPLGWPTATDDWGTASGWALATTPMGGDVIVGGMLRADVLVEQGATVMVDAGSLRIGVS